MVKEEKRKKALIVVDFQKDFVDGALGFDGAETLDQLILERITEYEKNGHDVIYTYDTHGLDYMTTEEGKNLPVIHCIKGEEGWQLYGQVGAHHRENDTDFYKETFGSLDLGNYLREKKYDQIELCGLVSSICVLSNAVIAKSACPNAHIMVDSTLTGAGDKEMNKKALEVLSNLHVEII